MTFHIPWDPCRRAVRGAPVSVFPFVQHSIRSWEAPFHDPADSTSRPFHLPADRPGGRWEARKGPAMGLGPPKGLGPSGDSGIEGSSVPIARRTDRSRRRKMAGKRRREMAERNGEGLHSRLCREPDFLNLRVQVGPGMKGSGCPKLKRTGGSHLSGTQLLIEN